MILSGFQKDSLAAEGNHSWGFWAGGAIMPKDSYWENFGALKFLFLPLIWRLVNIQDWRIAANNSYLYSYRGLKCSTPFDGWGRNACDFSSPSLHKSGIRFTETKIKGSFQQVMLLKRSTKWSKSHLHAKPWKISRFSCLWSLASVYDSAFVDKCF